MGKKLTTNNNLEYLYPKIASGWNYKKNVLKPNEVFPHTNKKYWWICVFGHEYESSPNNRSQGKGCPYCSGQKAGYGNDIVSKFPDLIKDWDYGKNSKNPEQITPGSDYLAYWVCENNHSYRYKVSNRTRGQKGCRKCTNRDVANHNSLTYNYPELMKEWDYEKNTLNPKGLVFGTPKKVWWRCSKNHSWKTSINLRTSRNTSCPYCSGHRVSEKNNLLHNYPQIASEWDYEKNNDSPEDLPGRSSKKRWWICKNQHSYKTTVSNRTGGSGCPYCAGRSVGYGNDLKSIYPELCKEWDYEKNSKTPETLTPGSHYFAWWICKKGHTWKTKVKNRLYTDCPYCTLTPRSKDELYLLFELKNFFQIKEGDNKIKLDRINDVDIKLNNEKIVIEYDGAYWHKDKADRDKTKTKNLKDAGWTVIRVREEPLDILSKKYNVSSISRKYKLTANSVLKKLDQLGFEVKGLDNYLKRNTLVNKKNADKYIEKLLNEKL